MSDSFIGYIKMFAGKLVLKDGGVIPKGRDIASRDRRVAPRGYAFCNGQLLSISQNNALFSLLGTTYGGDGVKTFALPDLRGRAPMHEGQASNLSSYYYPGASGGDAEVMLSENNLPRHTHELQAASSEGVHDFENETNRPSGHSLGLAYYKSSSPNLVNLSSKTLGIPGGRKTHPNMQPYLAVDFIIATVGILPQRD